MPACYKSFFFTALFLLSFGALLVAQPFQKLHSEVGLNHIYDHTAHIGGGATIIDINNDGYMDVYLPGGNETDQLLLNQQGQGFVDIAVSAGLGLFSNRYTVGAVSGDLNNDGYEDLFITTWRFSNTWGGPPQYTSNVVMLNNGNLTFSNVTGMAGVFDAAFSGAAALLDFNHDSFLDIYVANYVDQTNLLYNGQGQVSGFAHDCFDNYLYVSNQGLFYEEEAAQYGVNDNGCGLGVISSDFNFDGHTDLMVINDFGQWVSPNVLYMNTGQGFQDISEQSGADAGIYGMGVANGDYDEDGDLDYYITNLGRNVLFRQDAEGVFSDVTETAGVENTQTGSQLTTGWGTFFFDYDNDSHLDLFVSNGRVPAAPFIATALYDPNKFYRNNHDGTFTDIAPELLLNDTAMGRGAVFFDFNNDGKLDILQVNIPDAMNQGFNQTVLYLNQTDNDHHYIMFHLKGTTVNKSAIGARVELFANGRKLIREVDGGSGFSSHNDKRLHFGLGQIDQVDSVLVYWPGIVHPQRIIEPQVDEIHVVVQEDVITTNGMALQNEILLFPNPTSGTLRLQWKSASQGLITLRLFNASGAVLNSAAVQAENQSFVQLDDWVHQLAPGIYTLQLAFGEEVSCQRLVVVK